jgi:protein PhnA
MSEEMKVCPLCTSPYGYASGEETFTCPDCGNEWIPGELSTDDDASAGDKALVVKDANGNLLQNGDTVIVIKNLPIKGAAGPLKAGTKVKNIRLAEGDHNIDCKISGFGAIALKSEFVKKVT